MKLLAIAVSSLLLLAACSKKEDSAPTPPPAPKYITLPSGERVLVNPQQDISKSPLKRLGPVYEEAKACIRSICDERRHDQIGPALLNEKEMSLIRLGSQLYYNELGPTMNQLIKTKKAQDSQSNNDLQSLLDDMQQTGPLDLTQSTQNYVRLSYALSLLADFKWADDYDQQHFRKTKKIKLNATGLEKIPAEKKADTLQAVDALNQFVRKTSYKNNYQYIEAYDLRNFLLITAKGKNLEQAHNLFIRFIKGSLSAVVRSYPNYKAQFDQDFVLQKFFKKEALNKIEHESLAKTLQRIAELYAVARLNWPSLENLSLDMNALTGDSIKEKLAKAILTRTNTNYINSQHDLSLKKMNSICQISISTHLVTRPSDDDLKVFAELLPKIKVAAKKVAQQVYPNASAQDIAEIIDTAKFTLPKSLVGGVNQIKDDAKIVNQLASISAYKGLQGLNQKDLQNILTLIYADEVFDKKPAMDANYDNIGSFCMRYFPKGINDFAWTVDNRINISTPTLKNRNYTAGVFAHEISHLLSKQLSDNKNEPLSGCLKERHNHRHLNETVKEDQYLEEDRADAFGIRVLTELGLTSKASNFACILLPDMKIRNDKGDVVLGPDGQPVYVNSSARQLHPMVASSQGVHSAPTFRLINIAKSMGHMTEECESLDRKENTRHYNIKLKARNIQFITPATGQCTL